MIGRKPPAPSDIWLRQLERLARLQRDYPQDLNATGHKLIQRAMAARYMDLVRAGREQDAAQVLARINGGVI